MKNFNTEQTISNLERVQELLKTIYTTDRMTKTGYFDEAHKEIRAIKDDLGASPFVPSLCDTFPTFPLDDAELKKAEKDVEDRKKILFPLAIATVVVLVIYFISHVDFLNTIAVIGVMATAVVGFLFYGQKGIYDRKKKAYDDSVAAHNQSMQAFRDALAQYEAEKARAVESAKSYAVGYRKGYSESVRILNDCNRKRAEAVKEGMAAMDELEELDVLPAEYYRHVPQMISLLRSGRADDQKEALNMAIEIERQEEETAARRAEEERRTEILRKQAEEERRHNQEMERQQAAHDRAMERQAQENARAAQRQADSDRRKAADDAAAARRAGSRHCQSCANIIHCNSGIKNGPGSVNCGGYRPR